MRHLPVAIRHWVIRHFVICPSRSAVKNFFSRIFSKPTPILIQDEAFGQMKFHTGRRGNWWECAGVFLPENKEIAFLVDTAETWPPSKQQKVFLKEIERRYPQLLETWKAALEANIRNWSPDFHLPDLKEVFSTDAIEIPAEIGERPVWTIVFQANDRIEPAFHYFNLRMEGWQVTEILVDG